MQLKQRIVKFKEEVEKRREKVYDYIRTHPYPQRFKPPDVHQAIYSYLNYGGKSLRPAVLLFSCGAVGGDETKAIPAAAAVEIYHTWTLVHDDIIDRDKKRRGGLTVHEEFFRKAKRKWRLSQKEAEHYGTSVAIVAGDVQQGWATSLLCNLNQSKEVKPQLVLQLIRELTLNVQTKLLEGEMVDVQLSKMSFKEIDEEMILNMIANKTGALYEFCGRAGAMLGLNTEKIKDERVKNLSNFTLNCGIAFQLQDDILGIVADEEKLGKPVGSDIREGKRTIILHYALSHLGNEQRKKMLSIIGNQKASKEEIGRAIKILKDSGGILYTQSLANQFIKKAFYHLEKIPDSDYKELLRTWAEYMIEREF
ncbi:MAG: polyprenyl synthetase family protein [Candidatus Edwardsbacteria bacterium]